MVSVLASKAYVGVHVGKKGGRERRESRGEVARSGYHGDCREALPWDDVWYNLAAINAECGNSKTSGNVRWWTVFAAVLALKPELIM